MSGVEVAGLVLGALPLLIEAIKAYADGVSTVERYLKYEVPLRNLHRALGAEYVIYQNTCEELLNGLVENNDERTALLEQPGGPGWRKPALERKLHQRLSRAYTAYIETMEDMEFAVSEIKKLLKLGADGKVQLNTTSKFRKEYHRLRFSLKKSEYDGLLSQIQQRNARLRTLAQQTLTLEPSRSKRQLPDFDLIRTYAASVYKMLCAGLNCGCRTSHGINLRLEGINNCWSTASLPPFRVVISYGSKLPDTASAPWTMEAVDVRPLQNEPIIQSQQLPPAGTKPVKRVSFQTVKTQAVPGPSMIPDPIRLPNPTQIMNLCHAICHLKGHCIGSCLGFLEDEITRQRLGLYQPKKPFSATTAPSILSLHSILTSGTVGRQRFSAGHRLRLAVLLSSSLLQLYRTPWMADTWGHDDISFLEGMDEDVLKDPFISRTSGEHSSTGMADSGISQWDGVVLCQPLFALGILLIELCLGKPFGEIRVNSNAGQGGSSSRSDFAIANQLLDEVASQSGDRYSDAVRRCIRCAFDTRKIDLEDKTFRQAVYEGVIAPLEEDLKNFKGLVI